MNVLSQSGVSDYQNRTVTIEVTGVRQQSVVKRGSYQIRVPYSQMSQAMQTIHRRGGQVASVTVAESPASGQSQASTPAKQDNKAEAPKGEDKKKTKRKR